ncbi:hypothetical protein WDU94_001261 [Cyamophila willieti]
MSNEPHSPNEDEDVYNNVSFKNNKPELNVEDDVYLNKTNPVFKNNHKTFSKKDAKHVSSMNNSAVNSVHSGASISDGNCSNTPEGSSDEIYENYCTSTNGLSSLMKVETTNPLTTNSNINNSKTFTKHSKITRRATLDKFELKLENNVSNIVITSPSCSEFETTSSDDPREGTKSPEDDIVNENDDEGESLYENIETIREAMNKGKTYKKNTNGNAMVSGFANDKGNKMNNSFANINGNSFNNSANTNANGNTTTNSNFANDNLLVINERKLDRDSLDRKSPNGGVSGGVEREDKAHAKGKRDRSSKAR